MSVIRINTLEYILSFSRVRDYTIDSHSIFSCCVLSSTVQTDMQLQCYEYDGGFCFLRFFIIMCNSCNKCDLRRHDDISRTMEIYKYGPCF